MNAIPPLLQEGDQIVVISPSRRITPEQVDASWDVFAQWGVKAREGSSLWSTSGYFAGTDEERLEEWRQALADPSIRAIFCARGGYGLTRIIDQIDLSVISNSPKWIIGYSDITAMHMALDHADIASIHGLMPAQFGNPGVDESLKSIHDFLFHGKLEYRIDSHPKNRTGHTEATAIGGNLSLLAESLGTPTEIHTDGRILIIEEIDEYLYKIDRMMNQLKRAGKFDFLAGLVVGDFSDMKDTTIPFGTDIYQLIESYIDGDIPVAFDFPLGHENRNLAMPLGVPLSLEVTEEQSVLTLKDPSLLHQG